MPRMRRYFCWMKACISDLHAEMTVLCLPGEISLGYVILTFPPQYLLISSIQDSGDLYEFICDSSVQPSQTSMFELVAMQCQFERKYRRSHETASERELRQFSFQ